MTQHILILNNYLLSPINGFFNLVKNFQQAMERNRKINQTIKELRGLTDKELNDIGIARGDIYSIAIGDETLKRGL